MLDAIVGAVIVVVATSSMLYSMEVFHRAIDQAGKYPLNDHEKMILDSIEISSSDQLRLQQEIAEAPRQVSDE